MMLLHLGTPEPREPSGAAAPGDSPVVSPVVSCCCTSHRRVTFISFVFKVVLTVFGLCDMFEFCSKVCFTAVTVLCYSGIFMFYVVVVDLAVA